MALFRKDNTTELTSEEDKEAVQQVDVLVEEAKQLRQREVVTGAQSVEETWDRNEQLYLGNHWDLESLPRHTEEGQTVNRRNDRLKTGNFTINRTQQAVIAQRAMAFSRPVQFRFMPAGDGGEETIYMHPEWGAEVMELLQQEGASPQDLGLGSLSSEQIRGREGISGRKFEALVENGLAEDGKDSYRVNGVTISQSVQKVWDALYLRGKGPSVIATNELYCAIYGTQPLLFQWDGQEHRFDLSNPHIKNVWIDPTAEGIEDSDYVVLDVLIDLERAKLLWPDKAEQLEESQRKRSNRDIQFQDDIQFKRPMVLVRTAWLRHRPVPLTVKEALEGGQVTVELEDGSALASEDREDLLVEGTNVFAIVDGRPLSAKLRRTDSGGETRPGHQNWPTKPGVQQIQTIPQAGLLLRQVRCPYRDIPMGWNVNIPVPHRPYGQGDPERIEDLQQAINRLFTILHRHAKHYQTPMEFWPEDLVQDIKKRGVSPYTKPGRIVPVRRDIYQMMIQLGGRNGFGVINQVPAPPSFYVQILEMLLDEIDRLANFTDVLQGVSPGSDTSGRAIEALQAAARGPIAVKTAATEWMLERIAWMGLDAMTRWLPEAKWAEILDGLPLPVIREIISRVRPEKFNIEVAIASGRGINEAADAERALDLYMEGSPTRLISRDRAQMMNDVVDRSSEQRKILQENQEMSGGGSQ